MKRGPMTSLPFLDMPASEASTLLAFAVHHAALPYAGRQGTPGIDYAWAKPGIPAVKAAGDVFVAQYDSLDASKNLTPDRAKQLLAAGIKVVLVYEYGAQDALRGHAGGVKDAQHADALAKACGMPSIPVYFALDWDATPAQQGLINDYFDGAASVIGRPRTGGYGGYWPLSRAKAAGKITYLWGTPAWSGDNWHTSGLVPDIMQGGFVTVGGVQCDLDAGLHEDYGQWPRPAAAPGKTWGVWETKGHSSLEDVSRATGMECSSILRATVQKYGPFDTVTSTWLNNVLLGHAAASTKIPAGGRLWVRR